MPSSPGVVSALGVLLLLVTACASAGATDRGGTGGPLASSGPKVLTIGIQRAPDDMHPDLGPRDPGVGGSGIVPDIPHEGLMVSDSSSAWIPRLAAEPISVEAGTWMMNSDGTMVTTWKLRPNVKWHDGVPFTADDMVFSFGLYKDRELPVNLGTASRLMVSASAPDPLTFVVNWSSPFVSANRAEGLIPIPRHILEDPYRRDKLTLLNHPWFTTEFVGLGPYRLVNWDFGIQVDYARFDDYYQGRPPLDKLIVKLFADANSLIANVLAGGVDAILSEGIDIDASMALKERWEKEGSGNQVLIVPYGGRGLEIQHRPQYARPVNGLTQLPVRKGMYSAIDRQKLVDVFTYGYGSIADSWVEPWNPLRPQLEAYIPQFPYDTRRAQQYLAEGGWVRGADGIMVHQQTGDRFNIMIYSSQGANVERAVTIMGEDWKAVGADVDVYTIPISLASDREHRAKLPGAGYMPNGFDTFTTDRLNSKYITGPENNWSLINRGGYNNPRVDAVLDKLVVTIDPTERLQLHRDLLREQMGDVALFPLFYETQAIPVLKGVKNLGKGAWNVFDWNKE